MNYRNCPFTILKRLDTTFNGDFYWFPFDLKIGTEELQNKDEGEIAKLQHNRMHQIESLTIAPVIFMTILVGFLYEIYSRRAVLFFGFLILPVSMLFFWSTNFAMIAIAKIVLAIGCQTIF